MLDPYTNMLETLYVLNISSTDVYIWTKMFKNSFRNLLGKAKGESEDDKEET